MDWRQRGCRFGTDLDRYSDPGTAEREDENLRAAEHIAKALEKAEGKLPLR
jgi:hypothetical protein